MASKEFELVSKETELIRKEDELAYTGRELEKKQEDLVFDESHLSVNFSVNL